MTICISQSEQQVQRLTSQHQTQATIPQRHTTNSNHSYPQDSYQLVDGLQLDGHLNGTPEVVEAAPAQRPLHNKDNLQL